ncbi:basic salivary proline-rich protein 1-like isoform X2 [Myiozetetes cayanensis]|uniref:basic salivary proline-rich protein 1-like isoform X2 n=1 Tax=Myiozetetes cayanensis TaxID=478635 RepID=UPI00215FA0E6|nr:basic salivary proline-rich protein 1-like isoform X2 [Myiozetetes cayanensis]
MSPPPGRRRGFPREPGPRWDGAGPCPPHGPEDAWDEPPWKHWRGRGRGGWCRPSPMAPRPFPGPDGIPWNEEEEDRIWAPHDYPPPLCWDDREEIQGPVDDFGEGWHPPSPRVPRPFPGPDGIPWNEEEEDRIWAPHDYPPPPPWDDREEIQGPVDGFGEGWHMRHPRGPRPFPGPDGIPWNEEEEEDRIWAPHDYPPPPWNGRGYIQGPEEDFTQDWFPELEPSPCPEPPQEEEQPPPWPPAGPPGRRGGVHGMWPPWDCHRPGGRRCRRLRRSHRELTLISFERGPRPPRGHKSSSRASPSLPKKSQPAARTELQPPAPPQPRTSPQGPVERPEQTQDLPEGSGEVPKTPEPARTPPRSPASDPCAAGPEQAAPGTPVEPGAEQTPLGSQDQDPSALGTEPIPLEENSARAGEHLEVEPCSPAVPEAGTGDGSHPQSPAAPLDPAEREQLAPSCSGEAGAELSPRSRGEQRLPSGAGEAEAEAAGDGLLESLQPPEDSQVPPGPAAEPDAQPSQACPDTCTSPRTSPGPQHPPGSSETNPAGDGQQQLCLGLPTPSPSRMDLRSAAILARKEEIELSYQQFSLNIAVVATMLLQKEPSMEAALGLALRANLRQGWIHHLRELEDFIDSYDSATSGP